MPRRRQPPIIEAIRAGMFPKIFVKVPVEIFYG